MREILKGLLPTGDKKTDHRIEKTIKHIDNSLDPSLWETDSTLTMKGKNVFEEAKKAVHELMKIKQPDPVITTGIDSLVLIDRTLAQAAIDDAISGGGDAKKIAKAEKAMAKALTKFAKGDFDTAVGDYKEAWKQAWKALND